MNHWERRISQDGRLRADNISVRVRIVARARIGLAAPEGNHQYLTRRLAEQWTMSYYLVALR